MVRVEAKPAVALRKLVNFRQIEMITRKRIFKILNCKRDMLREKSKL